MLDYVKKLLTRENITLFIAIIGLVLSLWNFVKDLLHNRFKVKMFCKALSAGKLGNKNIAYLEMFFENCSRVPVSISRIFLVLDKEKFEFEWRPRSIFHDSVSQKGRVNTEKYYYSEQIPHTINGMGAWGGYFFLKFPSDFDFSKLPSAPKSIIIYTNRKIKRYRLNIPESNIKIKTTTTY